jgi:phosphotransferase system enzyme I (PtsI)
MSAADAPTRVLRGRMAAPGFAAGPLIRLDRAAPPSALRAAGSSEDEETLFRSAVETATLDLAALMDRLDDAEAVAMLEFQLAVLLDEALTDPVVASIREGVPADAAWAARLDDEIAGYRASEDDYFRARASDLDDIKTRVAVLVGGGEPAGRGLGEAAILFAADLPPSRFLEMDWQPGQGIALAEGSPTAHVAILARARGIPMLVGLGGEAPDGTVALLDAEAGTLVLAPEQEEWERFEARRISGAAIDREAGLRATEPAITRDGEPVAVHLNIGAPGDLAGLDPALCDGIGLVRTEFLFSGRSIANLPDEDEQFEAYAAILAWAAGRPVTIRTLDAGGDKPIPGYTPDNEANPFLGLRGVRLSLAHADVFRMQLRALLRAAVLGPLNVMVPMVTVPRELAAVSAMLAAEAAALERAGVPHGAPKLGMMVEVPAAALTLDLFETDFVSIGSNDLTQYVMAAGRDAASVADLADPTAPAVLRCIEATVAAARAKGIPVSLCGDAGGDPSAIPMLLATGLRSLSMGASAVPRAKASIRGWSARP